MLDRKGLSDTFTIRGHWFRPDTPEKDVAGTLAYSPNEIALELHGQLSPHPLLGAVKNAGKRFDIIHGTTEFGPCTLVDSYEQKWKIGHVQESTLAVRLLIMGTHIDHRKGIRLASVSFDWVSLSDFFELDCVQLDHSDARSDGAVVITATTTTPIRRRWAIRGDGSELALGWSMEQRPSRTTFSVEVRPCLVLSSDVERGLEWHLGRIWQLCQLFSLLTGQTVAPEFVAIHERDCVDPNGRPLFYSRLRKPAERMPTAMLTVRFPEIEAQFPTIIDDWLKCASALLSSINLRDWAEAYGEPYLESRFLTLCQSLEAFSRGTACGEYLSRDEYQDIRDTLKAAIPGGASVDHRRSLESRIEFGYEWSLRKRIRILLESLAQEALEFVCISPTRFCNGVVDTRNYLTHYTDDLQRKALTGEDLYWACEKVSLLLRILILKHIGLDESFIIKRLNAFGQLASRVRVWQHRNECVDL